MMHKFKVEDFSCVQDKKILSFCIICESILCTHVQHSLANVNA